MFVNGRSENMKLQPSPPPMGGEGEWYKCKSGGDGKIWLGWPGPASTKQMCTSQKSSLFRRTLGNINSPSLKTAPPSQIKPATSIYCQFRLFFCHKINFGSWLCFAFPPVVAFHAASVRFGLMGVEMISLFLPHSLIGQTAAEFSPLPNLPSPSKAKAKAQTRSDLRRCSDSECESICTFENIPEEKGMWHCLF